MLSNILIVDDSSEARSLLHRVLAPFSSLITECSNGLEAVRMYDRDRPDLVIIDIRIPGIDGIETLRRIRRIDRDAEVLMMTQYDEIEYRTASYEAGARGFVLKENIHELIPILMALRQSDMEPERPSNGNNGIERTS